MEKGFDKIRATLIRLYFGSSVLTHFNLGILRCILLKKLFERRCLTRRYILGFFTSNEHFSYMPFFNKRSSLRQGFFDVMVLDACLCRTWQVASKRFMKYHENWISIHGKLKKKQKNSNKTFCLLRRNRGKNAVWFREKLPTSSAGLTCNRPKFSVDCIGTGVERAGVD